MKQISLLIFLLLSLFFISSCAEKAVPEADISFFYLELCPGCDEYVMAEELAEDVDVLGGKAVNIIHDDDALYMKKVLEEKGLADIAHVLPLLIIEKEFYVGYDEIKQAVGILKNQ